MSTVEVFNLATGEEKVYTCSPREAVIAAYAQDPARKDFNTWDYAAKYGHLVKEMGPRRKFYLCGDWSAMKEI